MTLLAVTGLHLTYWRRQGLKKEPFAAVDDVSFSINEGECFGLIGESGSGKSTVSRIVSGLQAPDRGSVRLGDTTISNLSPVNFARHPLRSDIQIVFQDPDSSLNPSFSVERCIADPLLRLRKDMPRNERLERVREIMSVVGLDYELASRRPHQLSGGQKARVNIARAIVTSPKLLVLDEPTAALDVSVQATIMQLLDSLRHRLKMSYLFVTHDLEIVRLISDRIAVMQRGKFVEEGACKDVLASPRHSYTQSLLAAARPRQKA